MTPLVILPPPAAAELQGVWGALVAAQQQTISSSSSSSSDDSGKVLAALGSVWESYMAPFLVDLAYVLSAPQLIKSSRSSMSPGTSMLSHSVAGGSSCFAPGWMDVVKSVINAAAQWEMWELVTFLAQNVALQQPPAAGSQDVAPAAGGAGGICSGGVTRTSSSNSGRRAAAATTTSSPIMRSSSASSSSSSSSTGLSTNSNDATADCTSSRTGLVASGASSNPSNSPASASCSSTNNSSSTSLSLPSVKQMFQGGFWPQEVEQQYLAFKQSQLLGADTFALVYFILICLSVLTDRAGDRPAIEPAGAATLCPMASRIYMATVTLIPCTLLVLCRVLSRARPGFREWCAVGCVLSGALVTVPLALGWLIPTGGLLELTNVALRNEALSVISNGIIRPCAFQVGGCVFDPGCTSPDEGGRDRLLGTEQDSCGGVRVIKESVQKGM